MQVSEASWFAVQVRTRWECSIASLLAGKGYETLLPTYEVHKHGAGKQRHIQAPLFPGYVFCQFDVTKRLPILVTPGVIALVSRGKVPVPVESHEMAALQALVKSGLPAVPWPYVEVGQRVRIEDQSLRGLEGILLGFKGQQRLIVSVTLLQRAVSLEIDRARVSVIEQARPSPTADVVVLRPVAAV